MVSNFPKETIHYEILSKLHLVSSDLKLDVEYVKQLTADRNNVEELYRYVLFNNATHW